MAMILIFCAVLAVLIGLGYLAACAGAERWLMPREWLARTSCSHTRGRLLGIEFDGEAVYECVHCGKHIGKPLRTERGE